MAGMDLTQPHRSRSPAPPPGSAPPPPARWPPPARTSPSSPAAPTGSRRSPPELGGDAVAADVGDRAALGRRSPGDFDLVVANAGVMLPSPAEVSDAEDLERMLDANLIGLVNTRARSRRRCWPRRSAGARPTSSSISSIGARPRRFPGYAGYTGHEGGASAVRAQRPRRVGPARRAGDADRAGADALPSCATHVAGDHRGRARRHVRDDPGAPLRGRRGRDRLRHLAPAPTSTSRQIELTPTTQP